MQVVITSRHAEISENTREYGQKKIEHLSHIIAGITEVHLIIEKGKRGFEVELNLYVPHHRINVRDKASKVEPALDAAAKKAERRLRKLKTRIEKSFKNKAPMAISSPEVIDQFPKLIKVEDFTVKTLSDREATLQMRASTLNFLAYRGSEDKRLKIVYRRDDGNLGLLELEGEKETRG